MRVASSVVILAGVFAVSLSMLGGQTMPKSSVPEVFTTYCSSCHNGTMRSPSGVLLDQFDAARIGERPDVWARAYRQLQAGTMPPVGAPRPYRSTYDAVLSSIEQAWRVIESTRERDKPGDCRATGCSIVEQFAGGFTPSGCSAQ